MTNTCEIISFLTDRYYEMLPTAQYLVNGTNETENKTDSEDYHGLDSTTPSNDTTMDGSDLDARTMFEFTANTIAHLSMFFIMAGMTYKCFKLKLQKTALHAFLCTLGVCTNITRTLRRLHETEFLPRLCDLTLNSLGYIYRLVLSSLEILAEMVSCGDVTRYHFCYFFFVKYLRFIIIFCSCICCRRAYRCAIHIILYSTD